MAVANPNPTPATPEQVSPKVAAAVWAGVALVCLQTILAALTPEMFAWAGTYAALVHSLVTAVGMGAAAYLKGDPSRFTLPDPNLRAGPTSLETPGS